jgi:hypothetical protein
VLATLRQGEQDMWRIFLGACAAALCACGSSGGSTDAGTGSIAIGGAGDNAPAFVGNWSGTLTFIDPGSGDVVDTETATIPIIETAANTIVLDESCPDGTGLPASVTSATQFGISAPFACPVFTGDTSCASIVFTFTSLSGSLAGSGAATSLSFSGQVSAAGCGTSAEENISFSSTGGKSNVARAAFKSLGERVGLRAAR